MHSLSRFPCNIDGHHINRSSDWNAITCAGKWGDSVNYQPLENISCISLEFYFVGGINKEVVKAFKSAAIVHV